MIKLHHALIVTFAATTGFISLWLQRIYGSTPLLEEVAPIALSSVLVTFSYIISALTTPVMFVIISVSGAIFAAHEHHTKLWWLLVGLVTTTIAISIILKGMIMLPRPDHALIQLSTYGFPSAHAAVATVIFLTGVWITYHWKNLSHKAVISSGLGISWILISLSRISLGVHGFSDVLAGVLVGTAVAAIGLAAAPRIFDYYNISMYTLEEN